MNTEVQLLKTAGGVEVYAKGKCLVVDAHWANHAITIGFESLDDMIQFAEDVKQAAFRMQGVTLELVCGTFEYHLDASTVEIA